MGAIVTYKDHAVLGLSELYRFLPSVLGAFLLFYLAVLLAAVGLRRDRQNRLAAAGIALYAYGLGFILPLCANYFRYGIDYGHTDLMYFIWVAVLAVVYFRAKRGFGCSAWRAAGIGMSCLAASAFVTWLAGGI